MPGLIRTILVCMLLVAGNIPTSADERPAPTGHLLDGTRFSGETGEQGKGDHHRDTITFENGQFRSLDCEGWGFAPAPYTAWKEGDTYYFDATLESADRGTLHWQGVITGDSAEATFRWLHKRWYWTIDRQYWFKGIRDMSP